MAGDDERVTQLRKGALELAILAMLRRGDAYGGEVVEKLAALPGLAAGPGTVYPLLARLGKAGVVATSWRESPVGPPRKYYRLTPDGQRTLNNLASSWRALAAAMADLVEEADR